jgi:hypothetical protein
VWVLASVSLDRSRCATVAVALAKNRVYRAALDLVVALASIALFIGGWLVCIVRNGETECLKFGDRSL